MKRRGFALLAVLCVITGLAVLGLAAMSMAREAIAASRNRIASTRATWLADGCAERVRTAVDVALVSGTKWGSLSDEVPLTALERHGCTGSLMPSGYSLDVNQAGAERLGRLFLASGLRPASVDSLVQGILDWRDADDIPLPLGAEAPWYRAHRMIGPRNAEFADAAEVRLVRGVAATGLSAMLGTEPGLTPINLAPLPVVASLPGMSTELVEAIADRRRRHVPITDLAELTRGLTAPARDTLLGRFAELAALTTVDPEAWLVEVSASNGSPPIEATVQLRLARGTGGAVVTRKKVW